MSKRFAWLLGVGVLVSIGLMVACGSAFNSSTDGLVVVGSQGSGVLETFSFSLTSGHNAAVSNSPTDTGAEVCLLGGVPYSIVIDPAGTYAYSIIMGNATCGANLPAGLQAFKINSDGTIATSGSLIPLNKANVEVCEQIGNQNQLVAEAVSVFPVALTMDSTGKYLFVADAATTDSSQNAAPGAISVFAIGSGGTLTEVTNSDPTQSSPFTVPPSCNATADFSALAVSPTVFPGLGIQGNTSPVCTINGENVPTTENLYVADKSNNNVIWEFAVSSSTGALSPFPTNSSPASVAAGHVPSGVAVDPCNRFVYAANLQDNSVSAYTICNGMPTASPNCTVTGTTLPAGSLVEIKPGSPFSITTGNGPGPIIVDPFGNFVYALDTLSSQISILKISPVTGALTSDGTTATGGIMSTSMAIRGDDNWLFVTNQLSASLSEFSITPVSGALTPGSSIPTDNSPWGVAVK
jgi:DNA-binding beta-propeller fold protein YncE